MPPEPSLLTCTGLCKGVTVIFAGGDVGGELFTAAPSSGRLLVALEVRTRRAARPVWGDSRQSHSMWNQEQQDDGFFEGSDAAASRGEGSDEGSDDETTSTGDLPDGLPLQAALQLQRGGAWAQVVGGTGGWSLTPPSFGVTFTGEWDRNLYNNIVAGLQKLTWVVYPKDNARLLYALALQYRRGDWMSHRCVPCCFAAAASRGKTACSCATCGGARRRSLSDTCGACPGRRRRCICRS